jgi:nucleotide-binding universal stress UspA family protein
MQRIIVGYDGSPVSQRALDQAIELAKRWGAALTVLTAADDRLVRGDGMVTLAADESLAQHIAERGAEQAREVGLKDVVARTSVDAAADALIAVSKEGCGLLVVGHRGLGGLQELFLGSVAKTVVDHSACSVLVVR